MVKRMLDIVVCTVLRDQHDDNENAEQKQRISPGFVAYVFSSDSDVSYQLNRKEKKCFTYSCPKSRSVKIRKNNQYHEYSDKMKKSSLMFSVKIS